MKKVGILTLHYGLNYGGVLQTFATMQTLRQLGYDPEIIDRLPDSFSRNYPLIRTLVHPFTQRAFYQFRKKELQPISRPVATSQELTELLRHGNYHAIVIGSDQVWRKEVFSVDGDYYMIHQKDLPLKKIAYSASTGVGYWQYNDAETKQITAALKTFSGLSCREAESVPLFREHCGLDVMNILDPTLIANPDIYESLRSKAQIAGSGKLITYMLDWTEDKQRIVEEVAQLRHLPVQNILPRINKRKGGLLNRILYQDPAVYDWVNQIATADFVVTDSFHGMAFSIIFNKQFIVIGNAERGTARFTSLLGQMGIYDRMVVDTIVDITTKIDYSEVNKKLAEQRKNGLEFITSHL